MNNNPLAANHPVTIITADANAGRIGQDYVLYNGIRFPNGAGVSFNEILRDEQGIDSDINFKRYDEETETVEIISVPIHKFVAKLAFIKPGEDTWFARKDYGSNSSNEGSNNGMSNNGTSYGQQSMDSNGDPSNPSNGEMAGGGKRRNARKSKKSKKSRKTRNKKSKNGKSRKNRQTR
jgi:hypothetical protein